MLQIAAPQLRKLEENALQLNRAVCCQAPQLAKLHRREVLTMASISYVLSMDVRYTVWRGGLSAT